MAAAGGSPARRVRNDHVYGKDSMLQLQLYQHAAMIDKHDQPDLMPDPGPLPSPAMCTTASLDPDAAPAAAVAQSHLKGIHPDSE